MAPTMMQQANAQYAIRWEHSGQYIRPTEMHGSSFFLEESQLCKFKLGEGQVGAAYEKTDVTFLKDVNVADSEFLRKDAAVQNGIQSIVFMPQENGTLLELGFEQKLEKVPPPCLGAEQSIFEVEDRAAIKRTIPGIDGILEIVHAGKAAFGFVEDVVTKPDPKDKDTPDKWVPRNPWMNRLTGIHPFNVEAPVSLLRSKGFLTPATLHYVRNHGKVPDLSWHTHRIDVSGLVDRPMSISMDELVRLPTVTIPVTLQCAGNRRKEQNIIRKGIGFNWGCAAASTVLWTGVPLPLFLEHVGMKSKDAGANFVSFYSPEGECAQGRDGSYAASHSRERCLDPTRNFMLAFMMNGELLHPDHGFPVRLLCPGYIGGRMIKWLTKIVVEREECDNHYHVFDNRVFPKHVTTKEIATAEGIWKDPAYIIHDRNINSAIWSPAHCEKVSVRQETYTMKGYAYNGAGRPVNRVEVTVNGGRNWRIATITRFETPHTYGQCYCWVHWHLDIPTKVLASCGEFAVRAWDDSQNCQPERPTWTLMGMMNNNWFRVKVAPVPGTDEVWFEHPTRVEPNLGHYWDKETGASDLYLVDGKLPSPGWMERQQKDVVAVYRPINKEDEVTDPQEGWEVDVARWLGAPAARAPAPAQSDAGRAPDQKGAPRSRGAGCASGLKGALRSLSDSL